MLCTAIPGPADVGLYVYDKRLMQIVSYTISK